MISVLIATALFRSIIFFYRGRGIRRKKFSRDRSKRYLSQLELFCRAFFTSKYSKLVLINFIIYRKKENFFLYFLKIYNSLLKINSIEYIYIYFFVFQSMSTYLKSFQRGQRNENDKIKKHHLKVLKRCYNYLGR